MALTYVALLLWFLSPFQPSLQRPCPCTESFVMFLTAANLFSWLYRLKYHVNVIDSYPRGGHTHIHKHTDFANKSNFKKAHAHRPRAGAHLV